MSLIDPFVPFLLGGAFLALIFGGCMFWLGMRIGENIGIKDMGKRTVAAFDDGYRQGVREGKPKHDERGRFTS